VGQVFEKAQVANGHAEATPGAQDNLHPSLGDLLRGS